jgi:hypothetical protein
VRTADAVTLLLGMPPSLSEVAGCAAMTALVSVVRAGGYAELHALRAAQVLQRVAPDLTQSMLMQQYSKQQQQLTLQQLLTVAAVSLVLIVVICCLAMPMLLLLALQTVLLQQMLVV